MALKGVIVPASNAAPASGLANAALQHVANRPIICHVLEWMRRAGVAEVAVLVAAQERATVQECVALDGPQGLDITYLPYAQDEDPGTVRADPALEQALAVAADLVAEESCVVHVAEGLLDQSFQSIAGLSHEPDPDLLVLMHRSTGDGASTGLPVRRLLRLAEVTSQEQSQQIAGACVFGPGGLRRAAGARWWSGGMLDLAAVAERLVDLGGRLGVESVDGWRGNSGRMVDLLELNRIALDALPLARADVCDAGSRIEGNVQVHPTACVQASSIVGPAVIGAGALVLDSYLGPYTSIGADVHVEGAEVERSIILPGARITHIGGRMVGSVVGRRARVFRNFALPRALRLNVGEDDEVALC
jgi:glucose-1-phosphate thymidylyltransferase